MSLGQGLARLVGIGTMAIMARALAKEDVAAYRQTFLAYASIAPFLTLGIGQGMYYFLPSEKERLRGRVSDGLFALGIAGILFAIFIAFGGNQFLAKRFSNPQVAQLLLWMIPYSLITIPASVVESVLVARDRVGLASVFGVLRQLLIGAATLLPLLIWQTTQAPLIGNVVASILLGIVGLGLVYQSVPADSFWPSYSGIKELLGFTIPLALAGMFGALSLQMDKLIVAFLCSPEEFIEYSFGAMEIPLIGIVTGALTSVTLAEMRTSIVDNNPDRALHLFRQVARKSSYIILPAMVFLLITADTFIQYLYTSEYKNSVFPFRMYLILLPVRTVVFGSLIMALGRSRFILIRSAIGLAINGVLSTLLVWKYGPWGAVVATLLTIYIWSVPANLYILAKDLTRKWHEILPLQEIFGTLVSLVPLAIVSLVVMWLVENIHIEFAIITLLFAAFLIYYWNNRLFTFEEIRQKLAARGNNA